MKSSFSFRLFSFFVTAMFVTSTYVPFVLAEDVLEATPVANEVSLIQDVNIQPEEKIIEEIVPDSVSEEMVQVDSIITEAFDGEEENLKVPGLESVIEEIPVVESGAIEETTDTMNNNLRDNIEGGETSAIISEDDTAIITISESLLEEQEEEVVYAEIMRDFQKEQEVSIEEEVEGGIFKQLFEGKEKKAVKKAERQRNISEKQKKVSEKFSVFMKQEKERLVENDVDEKKQKKYIERLEQQQRMLNGEVALKLKKSKEEKQEIKKPKNPAEFKFENDAVKVKSLNQASSFGKKVKKLFSALPFVTTAVAYDPNYAPTLADVQQDGQEVLIDSTIQNLAAELNNNPVYIYNFVRSEIRYEPYSGAKKGTLGCLAEKICNDVDTSSLTIALLRAAHVPARYQTALVEVSAENIVNLFGVEDIKTVYAILSWNKVPVYVAEGAVSGSELETADFSNVTSLFVEWTFVQAFVDYTLEGNYSNRLNFADVNTTEDVRAITAEYPQMFWLDIDTTFGTFTYTQNEVVHDTANFDTQNFWTNFFQYQGTQTPLEKYSADLQTQTSKNPFDVAYTSTVEEEVQDFDILPPALPFKITESVQAPVFASVLDTAKIHTLKLELKKALDNSVVLTQTFNASEINNQVLDIAYQGSTAADISTIESYGGIHATPTELVDILPVFKFPNSEIIGMTNIAIGDSLILSFEHSYNNQVLDSSEKYSIAGNSEGIFMTFSQIQENTFLDDETNPNQNSKILLEGNAEIARQYLRRLQSNAQKLSGSLDVAYNMNFARAVVTQNRVLTEVNGSPTTFDFKGLTIDAYSYVTSASRRGLYTNNRNDFYYLLGLQASYDEADIFEDIAGLDAIATVQGLQTAYADSVNYTVHTITSANESAIDSLNLSANTKTNMHADIAEGRTIITPDALVTDGNWNGLFYVSYLPDGTAKYSIGEQVAQNGGWTTELVSTIEAGEYETDNGVEKFIFEENITGEKTCRIAVADFNAIISETGYLDIYGAPCLRDSKTFGVVDHQFTVLTDGANFVSVNKGYDYWVSEDSVVDILESDKNNDNLESLQNIELDSTFKFNSIAGTYSWFGHYDGDELITAYYEPNSASNNRGNGRMVYGDVLEKIDNKGARVLEEIGFPVKNILFVGSVFETDGKMQNFAGGDIYTVNRFFTDDVFCVSGAIHNAYKQELGVLGKFGFPTDDPYYENGFFIQDFENGEAIRDDAFNFDNTVTITVAKSIANQKVEDFNEGFFDAFTSVGVTGLAIDKLVDLTLPKILSVAKGPIFEKFGATAAGKSLARITAQFSGVGLIIGGAAVAFTVNEVTPLIIACEKNENTEEKSPEYYCGQMVGHGVLLAAGFTSSGPSSAKNLLGVKSAFAKSGKTRFYGAIKSTKYDDALNSLNKKLESDPDIREAFFERIEELKPTKQQVEAMLDSPRSIKLLINKKYYGNWFNYQKKVLAEIDALPQGIKDKFEVDAIKHIELGEFHDATGLYNGGGLHNSKTLEEAMDVGSIEVFDLDGFQAYKTFSKIPKDINGLRQFRYKKRNTEGIDQKIKTLFPDNWSLQDRLSAIIEASQERVGDDFGKFITKNGVTIKVSGYIKNGKISSGFPGELPNSN